MAKTKFLRNKRRTKRSFRTTKKRLNKRNTISNKLITGGYNPEQWKAAWALAALASSRGYKAERVIVGEDEYNYIITDTTGELIIKQGKSFRTKINEIEGHQERVHSEGHYHPTKGKALHVIIDGIKFTIPGKGASTEVAGVLKKLGELFTKVEAEPEKVLLAIENNTNTVENAKSPASESPKQTIAIALKNDKAQMLRQRLADLTANAKAPTSQAPTSQALVSMAPEHAKFLRFIKSELQSTTAVLNGLKVASLTSAAASEVKANGSVNNAQPISKIAIDLTKTATRNEAGDIDSLLSQSFINLQAPASSSEGENPIKTKVKEYISSGNTDLDSPTTRIKNDKSWEIFGFASPPSTAKGIESAWTEIRKKYMKATLKIHPDKNEDDNATDQFDVLCEAYNNLKLLSGN